MPHRLTVAPDARGENVEIDPFYIIPPSTLVEERGLVLKQDDTFALFDRFGDIRRGGFAQDGVYHEGTRYLSRLGVRLDPPKRGEHTRELLTQLGLGAGEIDELYRQRAIA